MAAVRGEPIVFSLLQAVSNNAIELAQDHSRLPWIINKETMKLSHRLHTILAALEDVEESGVLEDKEVECWLERLKDVVYDADDVFDELPVQMRHLQEEGRSGFCDSVTRWLRWASGCFLVWSFNRRDEDPRLVFRDIACRMTIVGERLDEIYGEGKHLLGIRVKGGTFLEEGVTEVEFSSTRSTFVTRGNYWDGVYTVPRLLDPSYLPESSCHGDVGAKVPFVVIVGAAGLGKTALAECVFNDYRRCKNFTMMKWLFVCGHINEQRLIAEIIGESRTNLCLDDLREKFKTKLKEHRFLIVLDDVRNENHEEWEQLRHLLNHGKLGSGVLVTTRSQGVVNAMGPLSSSFLLQRLSDAQCWALLRFEAFGDGNSERQLNLKRIGWEIAKNLNGNTLGAKIIGGLLHHTSEEESWRSILQGEIWPLADDENGILPVVRLGYLHLPTYLKQCFMYFSVFPKGYRFDKKTIVQMWMAHGYIRCQEGKRLGDIGSDYFDELVQRSFIQHINGCYLIHGLAHDLAELVSPGEWRRVGEKQLFKVREKVRHISFLNAVSNPIAFNTLYKFKKARTLLHIHEHSLGFNCFPHDMFSHLKCLRVLVLSHSRISELPDSIGDLMHLRYIDLSHTRIRRLPDSLTNLYHLQTLKLLGHWFDGLPEGISNLTNLCYLEADAKFVSEVVGIEKLIFLQEIKMFRVGKDGKQKIGELENLVELGGELCISGLECVGSGEEASRAKLNAKLYIDKLKLEWVDSHLLNSRYPRVDQEVLESLQPHPNLKKLRIKCNGGIKPPSWMDKELLSNLVSISIQKCRKWEFLPPLGHLSFLKSLKIGQMDRVKRIGDEFYGNNDHRVFQSLEKIQFCDMPEWEEWSGVDVGGYAPYFSRLCIVLIRNCPKLKEFPQFGEDPFPNLSKLEIRSCPQLRKLPPLPCSLTNMKIYKTGLIALPELWGCGGYFQSDWSRLSYLEICDCPDLKSLSPTLLYHVTCLETMIICDCEELESLWEAEGLEHIHFLTNLTIENSPKLTSLSESIAAIHTNLSFLSISACPNVISIPGVALQHLNALERLHINGCDELITLGLSALTSLKHLTVQNCPKIIVDSTTNVSPNKENLLITQLPLLEHVVTDNNSVLFWLLQQDIVSLRVLRIESCFQLTFFSNEERWRYLSSLEELYISHCHKLQFLPITLQCLSFLRLMEIHDCPSIQFLPEMQNLSSLQLLYLRDCPWLQSFPDKGLPLSLQLLSISGCPLLKERCRKEEGPDWPKIARIPDIFLN